MLLSSKVVWSDLTHTFMPSWIRSHLQWLNQCAKMWSSRAYQVAHHQLLWCSLWTQIKHRVHKRHLLSLCTTPQQLYTVDRYPKSRLRLSSIAIARSQEWAGLNCSRLTYKSCPDTWGTSAMPLSRSMKYRSRPSLETVAQWRDLCARFKSKDSSSARLRRLLPNAT